MSYSCGRVVRGAQIYIDRVSSYQQKKNEFYIDSIIVLYELLNWL